MRKIFNTWILPAIIIIALILTVYTISKLLGHTAQETENFMVTVSTLGISSLTLAIAGIALYGQAYTTKKTLTQDKLFLLIDLPDPKTNNSELRKYRLILNAVPLSVIPQKIVAGTIIDTLYFLENDKPVQKFETSEIVTGNHDIHTNGSWLRTYFDISNKLVIETQCKNVNKALGIETPCNHSTLLLCNIGVLNNSPITLSQAIDNELHYALVMD